MNRIIAVVLLLLLRAPVHAEASGTGPDSLLYANGRHHVVVTGDTAYYELYAQHKRRYFHVHDRFRWRPESLSRGDSSTLQKTGSGLILETKFFGRKKPTRVQFSPASPGELVLWRERHAAVATHQRWWDSLMTAKPTPPSPAQLYACRNRFLFQTADTLRYELRTYDKPPYFRTVDLLVPLDSGRYQGATCVLHREGTALLMITRAISGGRQRRYRFEPVSPEGAERWRRDKAMYDTINPDGSTSRGRVFGPEPAPE